MKILRKYMDRNGLTQVEVAALAKVSQAAVSKWLRGESNVSVEAALNLERATDGELSVGALVPRMK
jgi:transcriptional regulator with XRE-family HTH domain